MNTIAQRIEQARLWAECRMPEAVRNQDWRIVQRLIVLAAVCTPTARSASQTVCDTIAATDQALSHTDAATQNQELALQYSLAVRQLTGAIPNWMQNTIQWYSTITADGCWYWKNEPLAPTLLLLYRLLDQPNPVVLQSPTTKPDLSAVELLAGSREQVRAYVTRADTHANFGLDHHQPWPPEILSALEVRALAAARMYDLVLAADVLRLLVHAGRATALAQITTLHFLLHNQHPAGFFGYYDPEFQLMTQEGASFQELEHLAVSTTSVVTALREASSDYRLYRDFGKLAAQPSAVLES